MIGIVNLRSLGYYKIKQGILQQNLSKHYRFERVETLCEYFNTFVNTLKKRKRTNRTKRKLPWLNSSDKRKYVTDREILDKYIDLNNSCLTRGKERSDGNVIQIQRTI